ncbi:MAG: carbohydrate ABC transporter permease [Clostridiales bacterium]|nr:carbohydrate ABC transporter permease [Clostridiales bacterium]
MVKSKRLKSYNLFDWLVVAFFGLLVIINLVPILNVLSLSISENGYALVNMSMLFPSFSHIQFMSYVAVFKSTAVYTSLLVSILITAAATVIHVVVAILSGYALSIKTLPLRRTLMLFVLITMLFSGGLIPTYLTICGYGLDNTFWVMVLPGAVSAYSIILMKNFILNIPSSLMEASELDGANPFQTLLYLIVPLSVPIIATLCLFCAIGKWNDWQTAEVYMQENKVWWPFMNVLQNLVVDTNSQDVVGVDLSILGEPFKNALIVISILPVTVMYLFTQKFLVKGIFLGSVKE